MIYDNPRKFSVYNIEFIISFINVGENIVNILAISVLNDTQYSINKQISLTLIPFDIDLYIERVLFDIYKEFKSYDFDTINYMITDKEKQRLSFKFKDIINFIIYKY